MSCLSQKTWIPDLVREHLFFQYRISSSVLLEQINSKTPTSVLESRKTMKVILFALDCGFKLSAACFSPLLFRIRLSKALRLVVNPEKLINFHLEYTKTETIPNARAHEQLIWLHFQPKLLSRLRTSSREKHYTASPCVYSKQDDLAPALEDESKKSLKRGGETSAIILVPPMRKALGTVDYGRAKIQ